jgi:hypothetical protein
MAQTTKSIGCKGGAGAGTSGVTVIQTTVLSGDPTAAGPYTIEVRVTAHTRISAHTHRDDRSAVVVSGMWFWVMALTKHRSRRCRPAASTPSPLTLRTSP